MPPKSLEMFHRSLTERFSTFKQDLELLLRALTCLNVDQRKLAAAKALQSTEDLQRLLSGSDYPPWLPEIQSALVANKDLLERDNHSFVLTRSIAKLYALVQSHQWSFQAETDALAVDFDGLYERHREQSSIADRFDELIETLEQLVLSEEIDSRKAIKALEKLIATLKKNRKGSYFSQVASWDFVYGVFRIWLWDELCKVPAIGGCLKAIRKSLEHTNEEMSKLHKTLRADIKNQTKAEFLFLMYQDRDLKCLPSVPNDG